MDASLLTLPLYGYVDGDRPAHARDLARIRKQLGGHGLVYRYSDDTDDGLPQGEGAFGICGFWAVECLAEAATSTRRTPLFERLLAYANDVGLMPRRSTRPPGSRSATSRRPSRTSA